MRTRLLAVSLGLALVLGAGAVAQDLVNQGRPGTQGPWPVTVTATSSGIATASVTETGVALSGSCTALVGSSGGISLTRVRGWRVIASAPVGETFLGGKLVCCFYSVVLTRWMACDSALSVDLPTGVRDVVGMDQTSTVGYGRVQYLANGASLTSGSTITITYEYTTFP